MKRKSSVHDIQPAPVSRNLHSLAHLQSLKTSFFPRACRVTWHMLLGTAHVTIVLAWKDSSLQSKKTNAYSPCCIQII